MYNYIKENRIKFLLVPLMVYWVLLFIGTTIPSDNLVLVFKIGDKLKHFFAYFILAFLLSLNLHFQQKWSNIASFAVIYAFFITVAYGAVDELHQMLVPNRSAEFFDWLADAFGSMFGVLAAYGFVKVLKKKLYQTET